MTPGWEQEVLAAWDVFASTRLGPAIALDAERYAPVGPSWANPDPALHRRTPPGRIGGSLTASIHHFMNGHVLIVKADAPYAAYVELGTNPHPIDSLGDWSLWSPMTDQYFGRHVHHPGTRPQPFLRRALYTVRDSRGL